MADLYDLGIPSISDASQDEAIEMLRNIRLARRTPMKKTASKKVSKKQNSKNITTELTSDQAAELLKLIGG